MGGPLVIDVSGWRLVPGHFAERHALIGTALYLVAHVAFKLRALGTLSVHRLVAAVVLIALVPLSHRAEPLVTVAVAASILWLTIGLESVRHAEARRHLREAEHRRHHHGDS